VDEIWSVSSKENLQICCHQMASCKAKMHQIRFWLGLRLRPRWGSLQRSPRLPSWILGDLLLREGRRKERGREGEETPRLRREEKDRKRKERRGRRERGREERKCAVGISNYFRPCGIVVHKILKRCDVVHKTNVLMLLSSLTFFWLTKCLRVLIA